MFPRCTLGRPMAFRRLLALLLLFPLLGSSPSFDRSQTAHLVKDINQGRETVYGRIGDTALLDGVQYFVANSHVDGFQIWRTDGTEEGTRIVENIGPSGGPAPRCLTPYHGELYFLWGWEGLWKMSTQTRGITLVADLSTFNSGTCLTEFRGELFFSAEDEAHGGELWKTDGTEAGTVLVSDVNPGSGDSNPYYLMGSGENLYFFTRFLPGGARWALWKSDGTATGTIQLHEYVGSYSEGPQPMAIPFGPGDPTELNGVMFFLANDGISGLELWRTDATPAGTQLVRDIHPGPVGAFAYPDALTVVGQHLYFTARDGVHGYELWKSDGTAMGTSMVRDIARGPNGSTPVSAVAVGGNIYFGADDGSNGRELWRSDGSPAGTHLVVDVVQDGHSSGPWGLIRFNEALYFVLNDGAHGWELWKSDGTSSGTFLVRDFLPGVESSNPYSFFEFGGSLFFGVTDDRGFGLWRIDPPGADPRRVRIIDSSAGLARPRSLTVAGGSLRFLATDGKVAPYAPYGSSLWRTIGTEESTERLMGGKLRVSTPLVSVGDTVFFGAEDPFRGNELWKSDGTVAGTTLVKDIFPGRGSSSPRAITSVGDLVFFAARTNESTQLWRSDGTVAGTIPLSFSYPRSEIGGNASSTVAFQGQLFFVTPNELVKSDGTAQGTRMVRNLGAPALVGPVIAGGILYVAAGSQLWKSDGTEAGTVILRGFSGPISEIAAVGTDLYLAVGGDYYADPLSELWKTDGTSAGTVLVKAFPLSEQRWTPQQLTSFRGMLSFVMTVPETGAELWRSDGTESGTVLVKDIHPGLLGSSPSSLRVAANHLVFSANGGVTGRELWKSDATAAGTVLVQDIVPGGESSNPESFTALGHLLFFAADDGQAGSELWAMPISALLDSD